MKRQKNIPKAYLFYQEKFIKFSDIDYKYCSYEKAKEILGWYLRIPANLHTSFLNDMKKYGVIKCDGQRRIELQPNATKASS